MNRTTLLSDAQRVITRAKDAGRAMTANERATVRDALDKVKSLDTATDAATSDDLRQRLADVLRDGPSRGKSGIFSAKSAAPAIADKISADGRKALAPSGVEVAPAGLTERQPIEIGRVGTSLLATIPAQVVTDPPTYAYLRQTSRTNNAALVASGGTKPTSAYGLTRVEDRLRVIAHLSEPVDKYWLEDADDLRVFIEDEMTYGLDLAVEQQVLNGDGTGEDNRGILQTSGIQTQAWSVDGYETVRKALTKLQIAGAQEFMVALSPVDFEVMNLVRSTSGEFLATDANYAADAGGATAPPYGPAALRSWGARIVLSTALTAGQGVAFDPNAVTLYTDGQVGVEWNTSVGFTTNEVLARCEGRFGVAVKRPLSVVSVDMSAA